MKKPNVVIEIENLLDIELHPAPMHPDKLTGVMIIKNGQPKYAIEGEQLIGLNLGGVGLTDEQLEQILGKVDTSILQGLNLNANNLKTISLSKDFPVLQHLEICDNEHLNEIIFPSILPRVERLVIRDNKLERVILPGKLPLVRFIDGSRNKMKKVTFGKEMPNLEYMDWSGNEFQEFSILAIYPKMEYLYLDGSEPTNIPKEVYSNKKNCWEDVRNYFRELIKDEVVNINYRAKMILVGNGRVGKTSMLRRIKGEKINLFEPFTHGVQLGSLSKENLEDIKTPELELNVWDFGGQEIFYATHQFFLSDEAIYILAWTNEKNVLSHRERDKDTLPFDDIWRPNDYWLENIRLHGKESPIIMVQTNSDNRDNLLTVEPVVVKEPYVVQCINFSALKDYGLSELKDVIADKLNNDIPMLGKPFPRSYEDVYQAIIQLQKETATITLDRFNSICTDKGITEGGEHSVLDYLHKIGVVVYFDRPLLSNTVYIDPDWLTSEVYKLINNDLRKIGGEITQKYLQKILPEPEYSKEKRLQFIELLKNFHLIFEEKDSEGILFIAPQYLPEQLDRKQKKYFDIIFNKLSLSFVFRFTRFIPENVMINFLSRYGPYSNKNYWKNGICFENEKEIPCAVMYQNQDESLWVYSQAGEGENLLLKEICDAFTELSKNANAEISIDGGITFVSIQELNKNLDACRNNSEHSFYPSNGSDLIKVKNYFHLIAEKDLFRQLDKPINEDSISIQGVPPIYFSYAWRNDDNPDIEKLVTDVFKSLNDDGFTVKRDKENCAYGEYINEFMKAIGRGELVIVFLSKKSLFSVYCMTELLLIAQRDFFDKEKFRQRILPIVVEELDFDDLEFRAELMRYWIKKGKENKDYLEEFKDNLGDDEKDECNRVVEISDKFSRLITPIKNLNRGSIDLYQENDFAIIKTIIEERLTSSPIFKDLKIPGGISDAIAELNQKIVKLRGDVYNK